MGGRLVTQGGIDNRGAGIVNAGRISGVVAGDVSATSTDAVNGAQLYGLRTTAEQTLTLATNRGAQVIDMTQQLQTHTTQIQEQSVQLQAVVNGQLGVCTVNGGALRCSVPGQAAASASGMGGVAVGIGASAQGDGARALADPTTAIGAASLASGVNAVALGANARALAPESVALGQGSVADRASTVSVGSATAPRQIVNVAPGTLPTDAVNLSQLERANAQLGAQVQGVRDFAARGIAQAMAMPSVPTLQAGRRWVGAAAAHYAGQSALGMGFAYQLDDHWQLGGGLSVATGSGAQVGYQW
ncbi:YadA-like family protein [Variovorax sp. CAN2819]|uniref:YadA family autotransporter adhesin n=1 Tax=Variovorax sp. CAN15 TaxID=3046727 RepID=UPI002648352B|nr:YadA-like family protein [Variovorax sp. CAN15]MDN6887149.1 YadA-like family protein [Variovorax sp. CAN15]